MKINTFIRSVLVLSGLFILSCKKENTPDTQELRVYPSNADGTFNQVTNGFLIVGGSFLGNDTLKMVAMATRPGSVSIQGKFVVDTTLVSAYNKANKTNLLPVSPDAVALLNNGQFTIKENTIASDSVSLIIKDPKTFTDPKGYLIPLAIQSTNGQDKLISSNRKSYYIVISSNKADLTFRSEASSSGTVNLDLSISTSGNAFISKTTIFSVSSSIPVPTTVTLGLEARNDLIASYNSQHNTSFSQIPEGSYAFVKGSTVTLEKSATASANVELDFDANKFPNDATKTYLLPIGIKSAEAPTPDTLFIVVTPYVQNIAASVAIPSGAKVDRISWRGLSDRGLPSRDFFPLFDGDMKSFWTAQSFPSSITIDMGKGRTLKGLSYTTGVFSQESFQADDPLKTNVAPKDIDVLTSTDGKTWKRQGNYQGSTTPDIENGIAFISPVEARYFRLVISSGYFTAYPFIGFSEIYAYQ